jgi:hypothetical protein
MLTTGLLAPAPQRTSPSAAAPARLLLLHQEQRRLLAALAALVEEGFTIAGAACAETARQWIASAGPPDALLIPAGLPFARAALAEHPRLVVVHLAGLPWPAQRPPSPRERVLPMPFTAAALADILAGLPAA